MFYLIAGDAMHAAVWRCLGKEACRHARGGAWPDWRIGYDQVAIGRGCSGIELIIQIFVRPLVDPNETDRFRLHALTAHLKRLRRGAAYTVDLTVWPDMVDVDRVDRAGAAGHHDRLTHAGKCLKRNRAGAKIQIAATA